MAASSWRSRVDELARPGVAGRDPLGDGLLELALLAAFLERLEAVPLVEEVYEDEREREHAPEQGEGHAPVDLRLELVVEDGPLLVQRAPPVDREVHDGHVDERDERRNRAAGGATGTGNPAKGEVADVEEEEDSGRHEPGVPRPPDTPHGTTPQRAEHERQRGEHDTDLRRRAGDAIPD